MIQACGGDKVETEISGGGSNNDPSGGGTTGTSCNCQWAVQKMAYYENYDSQGRVHVRSDNTYDDQDRLIANKYVQYSVTNGKHYLWIKYEYTYSYSGNTRTYTLTTTQYDENGIVTSKEKTTGKEVLYVK